MRSGPGIMIPPLTYIPEIHDVHPGMEGGLDRLLGLLPEKARTRAALLVVPDWSGCQPLTRHPRFSASLRDFPGPKVLHGLTHTLGRDWWNTLAYGTENHAEFRTLDQADARSRLHEGARIYEDALGEMPAWFCAPRWQQSAAVRQVLGGMGFTGCMHSDRYEWISGGSLAIPALCFDEGAHAWRRVGGWMMRSVLIRRWLARGSPFRLTLHPRDLQDPQTLAQITGLISALEDNGWTAMAFDSFQVP